MAGFGFFWSVWFGSVGVDESLVMKEESGRAAAFALGVRALLPMHLGVAPFGVIYGVVALQSGIPPLAAIAMSSIVFAGSAQFLLAQLVGAGRHFYWQRVPSGSSICDMRCIAHRWRQSLLSCRCAGSYCCRTY